MSTKNLGELMRIVYLHQYFNTPAMHGGTRSFEMARRLVDNGHEVHMVTSSRSTSQNGKKHRWQQTQEAGILVHWLPVPYSNDMTYRNRMKAFFAYAYGAARKAAALNGDVVFATSTPLTIALPAAYAARLNRAPMVFEARDLWPRTSDCDRRTPESFDDRGSEASRAFCLPQCVTDSRALTGNA
ncbi:MAG: glycosyltransferase [Trueperaceae bacterium]|nr:glycosyltransferase [Trueperaceae bacterium]